MKVAALDYYTAAIHFFAVSNVDINKTLHGKLGN